MITTHVGIKELKAKLSSYITRVRNGECVVVTDRGHDVATIMPISGEIKAMQKLVKAGNAQWAGGKPSGMKGIKIKGGPISETILEERQ